MTTQPCVQPHGSIQPCQKGRPTRAHSSHPIVNVTAVPRFLPALAVLRVVSEHGAIIQVETLFRKEDLLDMSQSNLPSTTRRLRSLSLTSNDVLANHTPIPEDAAESQEPNIENVVLGDLAFKTWYPSFNYPKEILAGVSGARDGRFMDRLERLYVCKSCFAYCKEIVVYYAHLRNCPRRPEGGEETVPGMKIYEHGDGTWSVWEVDGEVDTVCSIESAP
jgi:hypothetical protein